MPVLVDKRIKGPGRVALVRQAVKETLRLEGAAASCEVSVVLGDDALLRVLNRQYMGIDAPTDVLSFPQWAPQEDGDRTEWSGPLGDIVVSLPAARRQAVEHNVPFERELVLLVVHATLHLLGYDHARPGEQARMWQRQDRIVVMVLERARLSLQSSIQSSIQPSAQVPARGFHAAKVSLS